MTHPLPALTLVTGGAASGKSRLAEALVTVTGRPRVYVATAQALDDEMRAKIAAHRTRRGPDWRTVEAPLDPGAALAEAATGEVVLIDCATLWLTNLMLADSDIAAARGAFTAALSRAPCPVVIVTNEVGAGIVPEGALARRFRAEQGRLNQILAGQCDLVVAVMSGLPLVLKGSLPDVTP